MKMMLKCIPLLTFALQVYPVCMAQTDQPSPGIQIPREKFQINDPGIPGISLSAADKPYQFTIRNGTQHSIVAMATQVLTREGVHITYLDGLVGAFDNLLPGGIAVSGPAFLRVGKSGFGDGGMAREFVDEGILSGGLYYVLFDDGSFYGPDTEAKNLNDRIRHRKQLFEEAAKSSDLVAFIEETRKCGMDVTCVDKSSISREAWNARNEALNTLGASSVFNPGQEALVLAHLAKLAANHVGARRVIRSALSQESKEKPENPTDKWVLGFASGTCSNDNPAFAFRVSKNCVYPLNATTPNSGSFDKATVQGHQYHYTGHCLKQTGQISPTQYMHDSGWFNKLVPSAPDNQYLPHQKTYNSLFSNYAAYNNWPADTVTSSVLVGIIEPFDSAAVVDGGITSCYVVWQDSLSLVVEDAIALTPANTTPQISLKLYGYTIANKTRVTTCGGSDYSTILYDDQGWPLHENANAGVACVHETPSGGGGGGECDPADYCCCVAGGVDPFSCALLDPFGEDPACTGGYYEAVGVIASQGLTAPAGVVQSEQASGGTIQTPTFGILRSGNTFLLDDGSYVIDTTNQTVVELFQPPNGNMIGDIAVAGDWEGTGETCVGFYRPSTGQWFLDANCDGVWTPGVDYQYQFGGLQASGTPHTSSWVPGDVPVVGDWQGLGRTCIGIFRAGFLWMIDSDCDGGFSPNDNTFGFGGNQGDIPVVGHWTLPWNGNRPADQVGVVRAWNNGSGAYSYPYYWVLDGTYAIDPTQANHVVGQGGTNCSTLACATPAPFGFGGVGGINYGYGPFQLQSPLYDQFIVGDWDGTGVSRAGVYRIGTVLQDIGGTHAYQGYYQYGGAVSYLGTNFPYYSGMISNYADDKPLVGKW